MFIQMFCVCWVAPVYTALQNHNAVDIEKKAVTDLLVCYAETQKRDILLTQIRSHYRFIFLVMRPICTCTYIYTIWLVW